MVDLRAFDLIVDRPSEDASKPLLQCPPGQSSRLNDVPDLNTLSGVLANEAQSHSHVSILGSQDIGGLTTRYVQR